MSELNIIRMKAAARIFASRYGLEITDKHRSRIARSVIGFDKPTPLIKIVRPMVDLPYPYNKLFILLKTIPTNQLEAYNLFESQEEEDIFSVGACIFDKPIMMSSFFWLMCAFIYYNIDPVSSLFGDTSLLQITDGEQGVIFPSLASPQQKIFREGVNKTKEVVALLYNNLFVFHKENEIPPHIAKLAYNIYLKGTCNFSMPCISTATVSSLFEYLPYDYCKSVGEKTKKRLESEAVIELIYNGKNYGNI